MNLDQNYTITTFPPAANSGGIFHTVNISLLLALLYDQDYNISVVASNCIGNSAPTEIRVRLIGNCSLRKDDILKVYCLPDITAAQDEMMAKKSTNDSNSDLGPNLTLTSNSCEGRLRQIRFEHATAYIKNTGPIIIIPSVSNLQYSINFFLQC